MTATQRCHFIGPISVLIDPCSLYLTRPVAGTYRFAPGVVYQFILTDKRHERITISFLDNTFKCIYKLLALNWITGNIIVR